MCGIFRLNPSDEGKYTCVFDIFGFYEPQFPKNSMQLYVKKKVLYKSGIYTQISNALHTKSSTEIEIDSC